jgi:hypothetical protein
VLITLEPKMLRGSLTEVDTTSLPEHKTVELILLRTLPSQDVKPLVKKTDTHFW